MKIKLDENMPATLAAILTAYGHDTDTVHEEGLTGKSDHDFGGVIMGDMSFREARAVFRALEVCHLPTSMT